MSHVALDRLVVREQALVAALDDGDAVTIDQAALDLRGALVELAAIAAWTDDAATRASLAMAAWVADGAGARVNYLADRTRRQLDRLAALSGGPRTHAYGRRGRLG